MPFNTKLLAEICKTPGAPGFEQRVRELVMKEIKPLVDEIEVDNMGNVYAIKKGVSKENKNAKSADGRTKIMIGAHMDEIGFMVSHIDEKGFLRFHPLGGFDPKTLTAQRVIIHGKKDVIGVMASKPIHVMTQEERQKVSKLTDYFIDTGLPKKEVEKLISIGDPITREREFIEMGNCVNSKSLDNRLAVFILIETLRKLKNKKIPYDLYGVFTVQEEVGIRGANVASMRINPDFGFGLDTTIAFDLPGASEHEKITKLGEGTAIKIMDAGTICDYRMVDYMKKTADKKKIKWQAEILPAGGTDTSGIQRMTHGGSIAGAVSIPTRHLHQVIEMADKDDIQSSIELLTACISEIDSYNWKFK
ncbi:MAG: M42 family metallopeptidase [Crocinitomicaceae bacterium]